LPAEFGRRPIVVSPDARLRFLRPGAAAFDLDLLGYVARYVQPGWMVWDIGANLGEFAIAAGHRVGASGYVLAVEPDIFLAGLLRRSLEKPSNRDLHIDVVCAAIAERPGIEAFHIAQRGRAANSLVRGYGTPQSGGVRAATLVATTTLDQLLEVLGAPALVTVDVEGAEELVLAGSDRLMREVRPIWLIEVCSQAATNVTAAFHAAGYLLFDARRGIPSGVVPRCMFDTLAVPREQALKATVTLGGKDALHS
jgi:FkbM family methyltransferase